jgi:hypothetical protein
MHQEKIPGESFGADYLMPRCSLSADTIWDSFSFYIDLS